MIASEVVKISYRMTPETMDSFVRNEIQKGASENMVRRFRGTLKVVYDYLPEDKLITKERLIDWRKSMEESGYASITILNYVKYINRYLDFVGCSDIRFNRGKAKDLSGMTFGYLKAIRPTGAKNRKDIVWLFECKCGNTIELPATRVLAGNTLSCGCLKGASLRASRKYYDGTSLVQSMTEAIESKRSVSGFTGVTPKRNKWQAYITYKGIRYSLGCYSRIEDAIKARAKGKELVIADAKGLLDFYTELEKSFPQLPSRRTELKKEFSNANWIVNNTPASAATRSDNKSGCTGVTFNKRKWEARICYRGIRYMLGRFDDWKQAEQTRQAAEQKLKADPQAFVEEYSAKYRYYLV